MNDSVNGYMTSCVVGFLLSCIFVGQCLNSTTKDCSLSGDLEFKLVHISLFWFHIGPNGSSIRLSICSEDAAGPVIKAMEASLAGRFSGVLLSHHYLR